jgi:putative hydrolase of the HAD superfamily
MPITTILFDAGNTLVKLDFGKVAKAFAAEGCPVAADALETAAGEGRAVLDRFLSERSASTETPDTLAFYFAVICEGAGISDTDVRSKVLTALAPRIHELWNVPTDGARRTVERLIGEGFKAGVVSNSNGTIEQVIGEAGLGGLCEAIVDSGAVGVEKPDPGIFRIALDALGAEPGETAYVGDLPCVDVVGARAAGIMPVLIDPFDAFPEADVPRIERLDELPIEQFGVD